MLVHCASNEVKRKQSENDTLLQNKSNKLFIKSKHILVLLRLDLELEVTASLSPLLCFYLAQPILMRLIDETRISTVYEIPGGPTGRWPMRAGLAV